MAAHVVVTPPSVEPVSVAELKNQLGVYHDDDNTRIAALGKAAREEAEAFLRRTLLTTTYDGFYDEFATNLRLERPPLQSVSSVKYIDTDGVTQTEPATTYDVDTKNDPGWVRLAFDKTWPTTRAVKNAVEVRYVSGYGNNPQDVPETIRAALLMHVEHYYMGAESRGLLDAFYALLRPFRFFWMG